MSDPGKALKLPEMFRPPVNRAMRILDRSYFKKDVPLAAARVLDNSQINRLRILLHQDLLQIDRMQNVRPDPEENDVKMGRRALLMRPDIDPRSKSCPSPAPASRD